MSIPDLAPPVKSDKPETNWSILSNWFYLLWKFVRTPALIGQPTTPTGPAGDGSTQISNDAFVQQELASAKLASNNLGDMYGMSGVDGILTDLPGVWIDSFVPTVTSDTGTLTSANASMRYKVIGKTMYYNVRVNIVTNGTGAGYIKITMPFTPFSGPSSQLPVACGRENAISGFMVQCIYNLGLLYIAKYDGTYPGANGNVLQISGVMELI